MLKTKYTWGKDAPTIADLVGQTVVKVNQTGGYEDQLEFILEDGRAFIWYHSQSCCEGVSIEDITGSLDDLIGSPILVAEERTQNKEDSYGAEMWTFYEFATNKGSVTIRWFGESNGYYSVDVDFCVLTKEEVDSQTP